jgi:hypothetical protein
MMSDSSIALFEPGSQRRWTVMWYRQLSISAAPADVQQIVMIPDVHLSSGFYRRRAGDNTRYLPQAVGGDITS